jgi:hypothetical protein
LLAKLKEGEKIDENTSYDISWIDDFDGFEVVVDKKDPKIIKLTANEETRLGKGYERKTEIQIFQPREDAWIIWR